MSPGERPTVLVVGATGFVGGHLVEAARDAGFAVVAAGRRASDADLACDLRDAGSVDRALRAAAPDAIVNLAGLSSVARSLAAPAETFEVNTVGVVRLLDAVARHASGAHVLCVSSGDVYGAIPESRLPAREEEEPRPRSPYAASKAAMELVCGQYRDAAGLAVTVTRSFSHTGPGQGDEFAASSFGRQIAQAELSGVTTAVLRTGTLEPVRDFTDVRDIVRAYLMLLDRRLTGTFNVCSGRPVVLRDLVGELAAQARIEVRTEVDPARLRGAEVTRIYGSPRRLEEATGWRAELPLSRTLGDLLDWWRGKLPR